MDRFKYQGGSPALLPRSFKTNEDNFVPLRLMYDKDEITLAGLSVLEFELYVAPPPVPPTTEQLLASIKEECGQHIEGTLGWTDRLQRSITIGLHGAVVLDAMATAIDLCLVECNRCEDLIDAEQAYTASWPATAEGALSYQEAKLL